MLLPHPNRALTARVLTTLCGVALMFSVGADSRADSPDWVLDAIDLATGDPRALHYLHGVDRDCPFDGEEVERIIKQVLVASDVRPRDLSRSRELFEQLVLDVAVSCLAGDDRGFVYVVDAYFALHSPLDGKRLFIAQRFGRFGAGDRDAILKSIRDSTEDAVTAFVHANRSR